jgi:ClpP class serine protease
VKRHRYDRQGLLAIEPKAFFLMFADSADRSNERVGDNEIVSISGPLDHHSGWWCDSYDDILGRVDEACEGDAKRVILKVDSPGGLVSGCFETARAIREKCATAGKQLVAYVDGSACSAAYALASSAEKIVVPETGFVGSIGVIDTRVDVSQMDAAMGLKVAFITSGARKADGNPHLPMSKDELEERQSTVDALAGMFFGLVAEMRGGSPASLKALEARVFFGEGAVSAGLADQVGTFESLLAEPATEPKEMTMNMAAVRSALEKAAKGSGAEAEQAKRALAAMDGKAEESDKDKKKDDAPEESKAEESDDDKEAATAESDDDKKDDEKKDGDKDKESKASASTSTDALKAVVDEQRRAFLDTRPDLTAEQRAAVADLPMASVRAVVNAIPKPAKPKHAATATVTPTRGAGQASGAERAAAGGDPELERIDNAMGLYTASTVGSKFEDGVFTLGAPAAKKGA